MKIRPLTNRQEQKLLRALLSGIGARPDNRFMPQVRREIVSIALGVMLIALILVTLKAHEPLAWISLFGGLFIGVAYSFLVRRDIALRQWPAFARCLDRESIEARLRELEA